ncbi:hypothetical protein [uncultured Methylobacterium sp.]|uniref:hypothetical protein n=1 Tax=uncultured Methylobacterium sp. TaxID=157278 RepID=UPI0035CA0554
MPAPMPTLIAALAGLSAMLVLAGPAAADAPGPDDAPPRFAPRSLRPPQAAGRDIRGPDHHAPPGYGRDIVRAYLPRNDNVPIYNEPPAR